LRQNYIVMVKDKQKKQSNQEMIENLANVLGSGLSVNNQLDFLCAFIRNDVKKTKLKIKK